MNIVVAGVKKEVAGGLTVAQLGIDEWSASAGKLEFPSGIAFPSVGGGQAPCL